MKEYLVAGIVIFFLVVWFSYFFMTEGRSFPKKKKETKDNGPRILHKVVETLRPLMKPDPVKKCEVYKKHGCSHVDGPSCDVETCTIRVEKDPSVIPIKKV